MVTVLLQKAQLGLHGNDERLVQDCLDKINALMFYRAVHVYACDGGLRANVSEVAFGNGIYPEQGPRMPRWPNAMSFTMSRVTKYYMDGRVEVIKDRNRPAPYWVVEHPSRGGVHS